MKVSHAGSLALSKSKSRSIPLLASAGRMGIATLISRVMGLVREQMFAFYFGAGNLTDAYQVAFRIPNLLRDLFAEGAMSASFVPIFTETRYQQGDQAAWRVAGLVFRTLIFGVSLLSFLGILFAPFLVKLYAAPFQKIPGKFELTVQMTRIMFPFFPLVVFAAALMGVLNACGVFFLPAFASALFNMVSIVVGIGAVSLFSAFPSWGIEPIVGMAIGVVMGGAVQAFCQLPALYRQGYRWQKRSLRNAQEWPVAWKDPRLRRMIWMMVPGTLGLAATQLNLLVNTILATAEGPGAVSWLNYAFRLMQFPIGVFGVSLASATLSRVSTQVAQGDFLGSSNTVSHSLKSTWAINLPASAGLAFLACPIIEWIFQYGQFYSEDTHATAWALVMYSLGLTAYSTVKVLVPVCYALGNTRLPVVSSVLAVLMTLILNLGMVQSYGYRGLALGTSAGAFLNASFLFYSVRKILVQKGGVLPLFPLFLSILLHLFVAIIMGSVCFLTQPWLLKWIPDLVFFLEWGKWGIVFSRGIKLFLLVLEGGILWMGLSWLLRLQETLEMVHLFQEKFKNKLKPQANLS